MTLKTPITELDFFTIKNQLKEFLRSDQSNKFVDYDFEGANISVLLDVLAYNTYQNNFYTNMAISEMFLDSAQLENSIVSHAKELNYLPKSATSASAVVSITIENTSNSSNSILLVPEGTKFTTNHTGERFDFYTSSSYIARQTINGSYVAENVTIYEGFNVRERFTISDINKPLKLTNENIDISSIKVFEIPSDGSPQVEYVFRNDIFGTDSEETIFYIEPSFDNTYEIVFGKNRFGKQPNLNAKMLVSYRTCSGSAANGACKFTTSFVSNATVSYISKASGGSEKETIEDTKFYAPRSIQIQERAVTERDYEILLKQKFNEIKDISVLGGDELSPPRFGKVAIIINVEGGFSSTKEQEFNLFLRDKTPVGIQPIFLQPEYTYMNLDVSVFYKGNQTNKTPADIEQVVRNTISNYSTINLGKFGSIFELSRISTLIDDSDITITSNDMIADPYILYSPDFNLRENPAFDFGTSLEAPCRFATANNTEVFNSLVKSSVFIYEGSRAIFEDNGLGSIHIVAETNRSQGVFNFIKRDVGTVDYGNGIVRLSDFSVDSYDGNGIQVFAKTKERNVTAPKSRILLLLNKDIRITVKETLRNDR